MLKIRFQFAAAFDSNFCIIEISRSCSIEHSITRLRGHRSMFELVGFDWVCAALGIIPISSNKINAQDGLFGSQRFILVFYRLINSDKYVISLNSGFLCLL